MTVGGGIEHHLDYALDVPIHRSGRADLINPTGVDVGSSQVDDPAMQDKSMESVDLVADIKGNVAL